jgi:phosphoribosylformylglycinamidine synthase
VQVGDPFEEKRLIEASLELLDRKLVVGIQDLGGAGLTCATSETAARAGNGMDVYVSAVPLREPAMSPVEIMTSESQERMLAIVGPDALDAVNEVCARWEVRASVVGTVTAGGALRILDEPGGVVLGEIPAAMLSEDAPCYDRPASPPDDLESRRAEEPDLATLGTAGTLGSGPSDAGEDLVSMLMDFSWIYSQYDHQLFLNTVEPPGGDAAVLRAAGPGLPPSARGLAISTDSNPRWCSTDPRTGTAWLVAESAVNVACAGARAVAVVNCLNFGNPEHEEVMWQLSESVDGMAEACRALDLPVVGGNVSLYNESSGADISPTPVVAALGVIDRLVSRPPGVGLREGDSIVLLGEPARSLAGSRLAVERHQMRGGSLPALDFGALRALAGALVRSVADGLVSGVHDISDGGAALCLAEMSVRSGTGFRVSGPGVSDLAELFSEVPGRAIACTGSPDALIAVAGELGLPARVVGVAGGLRAVAEDLFDLSIADLVDAWARALPRALGEPVEVVGSRR